MPHRTATPEPARSATSTARPGSAPRKGSPTPHRVAVARAAWGGGLVVASRHLALPRNVVLALGFRHLAQAAATVRRPDGVVARWGWTADAAHSVSMLGVAVVSRRWRAAALANAVVAAAWARAARTGERR